MNTEDLPLVGLPLSIGENNDEEFGIESSQVVIGGSGSTPSYQSYIDAWRGGPFEEQRAIYSNPAEYKIANSVSVILDIAKKGDLEKIEIEETKSSLKRILEKNDEIIQYQNKLMERTEEMLESSKDKHTELIAKIDGLSSDLTGAEQRLKEAIEDKYILNESDIIRSIKESSSAYTLVFSKISLTFTVTLLLSYYLLGVEIISPKLLYAAIIAFSTFFFMGKKGAQGDL